MPTKTPITKTEVERLQRKFQKLLQKTQKFESNELVRAYCARAGSLGSEPIQVGEFPESPRPAWVATDLSTCACCWYFLQREIADQLYWVADPADQELLESLMRECSVHESRIWEQAHAVEALARANRVAEEQQTSAAQ